MCNLWTSGPCGMVHCEATNLSCTSAETVCGVMMWSDDVLLSFLDIDRFGHLMYFHVDCASFHDCAYPLFRIAVYAVQRLLNFWSFPGALCVPLCVHYSCCVIMYMCLLQCFLYIPMCTCVHICFSLMAFICSLFVICFVLCIICVYFCDLHVYLTYAGMWAICVFHKTHYLDSKFLNFAGYRVFWAFYLFVCLCVLCVIWFFFWFFTIYFFFPPPMHDSIPPFALWFAHFCGLT